MIYVILNFSKLQLQQIQEIIQMTLKLMEI